MHGPPPSRALRPPRTWPVAVTGGALLALVALASVGFGIIAVPWSTVAGDLLAAVGLGGAASDDHIVIVNLRLPRALGASCVGGALGTAGCMLQALLRNPLASPTVIGTAQGAMFGAVLAIALGLSRAGTLATSFTMSVGAVTLVLGMARTRRALPVESVVVTGMAVALMFMALARLLLAVTRDEYALGRMTQWLAGGLWHANWDELRMLAPLTVIGVVVACACARSLDLLALGEADAHRLGLRVRRVGTVVLVGSCVLTSLAICIGGMVAFVGLIVPHACRRLVGPTHAVLLPASASLGAMLVVVTDTVARTAVPPQELPLTVVTSLVGVPSFLVILRALRGRRQG
ncbi:MAG: iron ABC transporter permease [Planctomycetota bacterium]